jgi:hypothetical protein
LKFKVAKQAWSDHENDLVVADYFEALALELTGQSFNKAERNRNLAELLNDRSIKAIEFKHQNISAIMWWGLGQPRISGYAPASNFQLSLVDAVQRRLQQKVEWASPAKSPLRVGQGAYGSVRAPSDLRLEYPPAFKNEPPVMEPKFAAAIARKYDVAARDEANRSLGLAGEEYILAYESSQLVSSGRNDLARKIRWTSQVDGDGAGYDIHSFEPNGGDRLIEVKTTNGWENTPFHISRNELAVADARRQHWSLVRLWDFAREPKAFEIRPPLDAHVNLTPTSFLATLKSDDALGS